MLKQNNGPHDSLYAQKLDLGWVIVGSVCLGEVHKPDTVNTFYTNTLENGRASLFRPCPNHYFVKETHNNTGSLICKDHIGCTVFQRSKDDDKIAPSFEDVVFLNIMELGFYKDKDNSWTAPRDAACLTTRLKPLTVSDHCSAPSTGNQS